MKLLPLHVNEQSQKRENRLTDPLVDHDDSDYSVLRTPFARRSDGLSSYRDSSKRHGHGHVDQTLSEWLRASAKLTIIQQLI
jgi:hypothetical protein